MKGGKERKTVKKAKQQKKKITIAEKKTIKET